MSKNKVKKTKFRNKPNSKLRKCVKITSTGKIIIRKCGKSHMLDKKSNSRKRRLNKKHIIDSANKREIKKSLNL